MTLDSAIEYARTRVLTAKTVSNELLALKHLVVAATLFKKNKHELEVYKAAFETLREHLKNDPTSDFTFFLEIEAQIDEQTNSNLKILRSKKK